MKNFLWISLFVIPICLFGQINENISTTPDTCNGNGAVSITLDGTEPNYDYRFLLERVGGSGPEDTKDETVTADSNTLVQEFNTLQNGTWSYSITELDSGNETGQSLSGTFTVADQNVTPNLTATAEPNCSNHDIIASASGGSFTSYELLDDTNNIVRSEQTSNIFEDVPAGNYRVVGITNCGTRVVQSISFDNIEDEYIFRRPGTNETWGFNVIKSCNPDGTRTVQHSISPQLNGSAITDDRFPITITYTVRDTNNAETQLFSTTYNTSQELIDGRDVDLDIADDSVEVIAELTDNCGVTYEQVDAIDTTKDVILSSRGADCGGIWYSIKVEGFSFPLTLTFDTAPAEFLPSNFVSTNQVADDSNNTLIYPNYRPQFINSIYLGSESNPLPAGAYEVTFTDECGSSITKTFNITQSLDLYKKVLPSCEDGMISAKVYIGTYSEQQGDITSATITDGPADSGFNYPYDVTPFIVDGGIYLESIVPGAYEFTIGENDNSCNVAIVETESLNGSNITNINVIDSEITTYCGTFDYTFQLESIHQQSTVVELQRQSDGGLWEDMDYASNLSGGNSYTLNVEGQSTIEGNYRVVFEYNSYTPTGTNQYNTQTCEFIYDEFYYDGGRIRLDDFYATQCSAQNDTYDLIIEASGAEPIEYKILSIDGDTTQGTPYQTEAVFYNVSQGTYEIEIKDDCGNTERASLNITRVRAPHIIADLCDGEFGTLRTSGLTNYETRWYKGGNLIAGDDTSDNILIFDPFDEIADLGEYYAEIIYTEGASCGPVITPTYNVTGNTATTPNAGNVINPNPVTEIIDANDDDRTNLFNYIENYDNEGTWEEVSTNGAPISNLLIDNEWYYGLANSGTYTFKHILKGTCSGTAETTVVIEYTAPCDRSFNQGQSESFTNIGISNLDKNNVEQWPTSVPNGFLVLESNTKGFTISRLADPENSITDPQEGMLVFDTDDDNGKGCFKLYNGTVWKCIRNCNNQ